MKYDQLMEKALANLEVLFGFWGLEFSKINPVEYDLIAKWRDDKNYGAVRFNSFKNWGADFAGFRFEGFDFESIGRGFDKEDFLGYSDTTNTNVGFNVVGLVQRIYKLDSYKDAAQRLRSDLQTLEKDVSLVKPAKDAAEKRQHELNIKNLKMIQAAQQAWKTAKKIKFNDSEGDVYFLSRKLPNIYIRETSVRFHPRILNMEVKKYLPTVLFKVSEQPLGPLVALHRIYLEPGGLKKAKVANPKMALARIKGAAIWFGGPGPKLAIAEGPENALSLRELGFGFVASTINSTNFPNLQIPEYVKEVTLFPDGDAAGRTAAAKAINNYKLQNKKVDVKFPPDKKDWNDVLVEASEDE